MQKHLVTCGERVKHIYPLKVHKLRETPFHKLDAFMTPYEEEQKLFKNWALLSVNLSVSKKNRTGRKRLQSGLVNICRCQFPFRQA